jgi:tight adherence protein B
VQRETGGNLAEIIESLAHLIRERFKLQGKVRVLSAEGRLSAIILMALPFLIILGLRIVNPEYISILFEEPLGRKLAVGAGIMMALGIIAIKRMIKINV